MQSFLPLHILEGKLLLLGLPDCDAAAKEYRRSAVEIHDMAISVCSDVSESKLDASINAVFSTRTTFYGLLSKYYKEA